MKDCAAHPVSMNSGWQWEYVSLALKMNVTVAYDCE